MIRHPRRLVVRFEKRQHAPPHESWGEYTVAVLECGHEDSVSQFYRPKRMACRLCPGAREVMPKVQR